MNWWDKIVFLFASIIVLGACNSNDDPSLIPLNLPKKGDNSLNIQYKEFEVPSGVLLVDSVHTVYSSLLKSGKRLMVGRYADNQLGIVKAQAYTQFRPNSTSVTISANAKLVSGFLILGFDYYHYGSSGLASNELTVHELTEEMGSTKKYTFNSEIAFDATPIGRSSYSVNTSTFDTNFKRIDSTSSSFKVSQVDSIKVELETDFTSKLFEAARAKTADYTDFTKFRKIFPGVALLPSTTDSKIVGFNMDNRAATLSKSRIVLNYTEPNTGTGDDVKKTLIYSLYQSGSSFLRGFTQISVDRKNTFFDDFMSLYTELNPVETRYYQSGNPVIPLVDFSNFLAVTDTIPNIIFNSVELSIDIESNDELPPPEALQLRILGKGNKFVNVTDEMLSEKEIPIYTGLINSDERGWLMIGFRQTTSKVEPSTLRLLYDKDKKRYYGDFTNLFQTLRYTANKDIRPKRFGLVAQVPWIGLSVNRFLFKREDIKLKVFYTTPITTK